jgi:hypothetical protein
MRIGMEFVPDMGMENFTGELRDPFVRNSEPHRKPIGILFLGYAKAILPRDGELRSKKIILGNLAMV